MSKEKKILISSGGTGGHVIPALSLYDFLFKQESLGNDIHEEFISKNLKKFKESGNF